MTSTSVVTDLYPHMPILRPHAARYFTNGACNVYMRLGMARALADSSNYFGFWEQTSQKFVIPCLGRR